MAWVLWNQSIVPDLMVNDGYRFAPPILRGYGATIPKESLSEAANTLQLAAWKFIPLWHIVADVWFFWGGRMGGAKR
jgi:hypothetical protein